MLPTLARPPARYYSSLMIPVWRTPGLRLPFPLFELSCLLRLRSYPIAPSETLHWVATPLSILLPQCDMHSSRHLSGTGSFLLQGHLCSQCYNSRSGIFSASLSSTSNSFLSERKMGFWEAALLLAREKFHFQLFLNSFFLSCHCYFFFSPLLIFNSWSNVPLKKSPPPCVLSQTSSHCSDLFT